MKLLSRSQGILSLVAAGALVAGANGQQSRDPSQANVLSSALSEWQASHGTAWHMRVDTGTGYVRMLFGGTAEHLFQATTDADYLKLARAYVGDAKALLGVEDATLVDSQVVFAPLALVGSTDKIGVEFKQVVNGVPVFGGWVNAILTPAGDLLAIDNQALPDVASMSTTPVRSADEATAFAARQFFADTGIRPNVISNAVLGIDKESTDDVLSPALVWDVEVRWQIDGQVPEGIGYRVGADGSARIVSKRQLVHHFDVGGTVNSLTTTGLKPDGTANPEVSIPCKYMTITSGVNSTTSDANGNFNFPGLTGPVSVTFRYVGSFNNVMNSAGSEYSLVQSLTGTGNSVLLNPAPTEQITAQANAFHFLNDQRDYIRAVNPADSTDDFVALANTNIASSCNAFYDGASTNYYLTGGGCPNTAYSTVVWHEQGHWLNDLYGSGNGFDGFGEGNSDVYSEYIGDTPIVGEDFFGTGTSVRDGNNTRAYCGDGNGGCYGEVHADGEVLMGVLWKVREHLNATYGDQPGDDIADLLNNGWNNLFNQTTIDSIIEIQWLTLDDDDGDINNGTPNYTDINEGFLEQVFPGFALDFIAFSNPIDAETTPDEAGPYGVAVDAAAIINNAVASATLNYSVDGGGFVAVPMTNPSGDTWVGLIPGAPSPSTISYYIDALDDLGNSETYPDGAPTSLQSFQIGLEVVFYSDDFEQVGDNGWTHAASAGADNWEKGTPQGFGGMGGSEVWNDPTAAVSGTEVWGTDLTSDGNYSASSNMTLTSPAIDLTGASGATLRYSRWLTTERSTRDPATVAVNGTNVFTNPSTANLIDVAWVEESLDISFADGNASTVVTWNLTTDSARNLAGWNIDDVDVFSFQATPTDAQPSNYGAGTAGTLGVPGLDSGGQQSILGNANFHVIVKNSVPGASVFYGFGLTQLNLPIFGGTLLVQPDVTLSAVIDIFGQSVVPLPIPDDANLLGLTFYGQAFIPDAGAPGPFAMTPGLQATIE